MNAFKRLLWKDWRMTQAWFYGVIVLIIIGMVVGYSLINYTNEPAGFYPITFLLYVIAGAYIPIMMITELNKEGKTQMWLYTEQPTWKLISSKFTVLVLQSVFLFSIAGTYAYFTIFHWGINSADPVVQNIFTSSNWLITLMGLGWAISIGSNFLLLWAIYHSLTRGFTSKIVRGIIVGIIVVAYTSLENYILSLSFIQNILDSYLVRVTNEFTMQYENGWSVLFSDSPVPLFIILYYAILTVLSIFFASRLMERHVEV
ncbi:hypothetical protein [Mangrovibacillus cuniculi]|uniref:Uncharacterized protein n=1 Tax=Mangrovibacillus cuniculi TaxID=2593652 RepID=A0A7S8CBX2_9BACI|nr:hypothetical protein [Mangrovibacillus cuniculi]QPC47006.1 hypothetical protein G8O30_08535 [Mangrovibacillus cuniculi]